MTASLDQEALRDLMARYVLGDLPPSEARDFERQMAAAPELREEVARLRRTLDLLPLAVLTEPPPDLRARVLAAAAGAGRRTSGRRRPSLSALLAAAAALAVVAVGLDDYRVRRELGLLREVTRTLQEPNVVLSFALRGTGTSAGAFGSVVLDLDAKKAALVVRRLPALPAGRVYRLWALVGEKEVPCGQFDADPRGEVVKQFPIPVHAYTAPVSRLIVTDEPAAESPRPAGPTVMLSS